MMGTFRKKSGVNQTYWGPPDGTKPADWFADIPAEARDEEVIEKAKLLVDACCPQNWSTRYGAFYYSFLKREFLLNQLLYAWLEMGFFPSGPMCIVDEAMMRPSEATGGRGFSGRKKGRTYDRPQWLYIPSIDEALDIKDKKTNAKRELLGST
jgi:hypothetical protein